MFASFSILQFQFLFVYVSYSHRGKYCLKCAKRDAINETLGENHSRTFVKGQSKDFQDCTNVVNIVMPRVVVLHILCG